MVPNGIYYFCAQFIVWSHIYLIRLKAKYIIAESHHCTYIFLSSIINICFNSKLSKMNRKYV